MKKVFAVGFMNASNQVVKCEFVEDQMSAMHKFFDNKESSKGFGANAFYSQALVPTETDTTNKTEMNAVFNF